MILIIFLFFIFYFFFIFKNFCVTIIQGQRLKMTKSSSSSSSYVIAIPTFNRVEEVIRKTLTTLSKGGIRKECIYLFVANKSQESLYKEAVPTHLYNKIVVGKKGITNQRIFISQYFQVGQYIVSMDDDVEGVYKLRGEGLSQIKNLDSFFKEAYETLEKKGLFIWGVYPVHNPFFMKNKITFDCRFIIGVMFGYINRHLRELYPSIRSETKEDYEQTLLFYFHDGGVVRFNNITVKTKFNAPGGLGEDRFKANQLSAEYLFQKYPNMVTIFHRKNGMTEIKLKKSDKE